MCENFHHRKTSTSIRAATRRVLESPIYTLNYEEPDNAAAEALNKLFKKEVVWREGPWTGRDAVEFATLEWVHWYNNTRPHSYCGDLAPAQFEDHYYTEISRPAVVGVPL
ncbi:integrase core domain-containing protein [Brevibacterium antiquum]|uniref:integrase core domain-containing protein n=1 Tax=Brevibacterium antiquum TaxID=234835 RepID=UPI000C793977